MKITRRFARRRVDDLFRGRPRRRNCEQEDSLASGLSSRCGSCVAKVCKAGAASVSFRDGHGHGEDAVMRAVAKLYLRTENATRILFLVDWLELENQALKHFTAYLVNDGI